MGQVSGKLCDQCSYCLIFLNLSRKKSLQYLELEDFGMTVKEEKPEILEEPLKQESPSYLVDPSEFLNYYLEPLEYNCEKLIDKEGMLAYGHSFEEGFLIKAAWNSKFSPDSLYSYFRNLDQRKVWDTNIEKIEELPVTGSEDFYTYMRFKKVIAISQRDSVIVSQKFDKNDGIMLVSKSCQLEQYPEVENITRMKIYVAGYYFKAIDDPVWKTKVFTCTKANFGGNMAHKFVLKATATALPKLYVGMEKCLEKFLAKK